MECASLDIHPVCCVAVCLVVSAAGSVAACLWSGDWLTARIKDKAAEG
jgi:hypothetical protein